MSGDQRPPQQQEQMYVTARQEETYLERSANGQQSKQMAPLQLGRGYQPQPAQMQSQPVAMQPQPVPMQRRSAPMQQQQQQQQSAKGRPQQAAFVRSAYIPHMHPHQSSVLNRPQQSSQYQTQNGTRISPPQPVPQLYQQQQIRQYQQQTQQQGYQWQPQAEQYDQQYQQPPVEQYQQQTNPSQPAARPLPMAQTRQQQLEQIRRLQDSHRVRVPAVTVGFPDESSRRQMARWNTPNWGPGGGGRGGGGGGRERDSFRTSRQRSASQQRLEAVGRPASLALPRAYEWPQDRSAPPQPPARFCEPSVTLPRRLAPAPDNTGSLPRHQRLGGAAQGSVAGWPAEADPRVGGQYLQPHPLPPSQSHQQLYQPQQQQQRGAGWYPQQQPAPGPPRWHEQSAAQQTPSVTPRGPGLTSDPQQGSEEPLYGQRVRLERYDDRLELSAEEHDV